jgi:hypothetical protein
MGRKHAWAYGLTGLAALAFAFPALGQMTSGSSTGSGTSGGSSGSLSGLSSGSGTGAFGIGTGSSGTGSFGTGTGTGTGTGSGTGTGIGTSSRTGSGTGLGTNSPFGTGPSSGAYGSIGSQAGAAGGTFFPGPTSGNPLGQYYVNPLNMGNINASKNATYGKPMYLTVTSSNTAGGRGVGGGTGSTSTASQIPPRYTIGIDFGNTRPTLATPSLQADIQGMLTGTSALNGNKNITVGMEKGTLVLTGKVASERDRRMAEAMARLSPGVNSVRNDLQVGP